MIVYPTTLIAPAITPINILHPGVTFATEAPIATPPANEAFAMSPTSILPLIITERAYVARVAPQRARIVFIAPSGILSTATKAEQNDGQKTHKAALPRNA